MNLLKFKVEIEGLEEKIWRDIEITDKATVADLAYTILATFNSLAYHLYDIEYKGKKYDCGVCAEDIEDESVIMAVTTKLEELKLTVNDKMTMKYDFGATNIFKITVLSVKELSENEKNNFPKVVAGAGLGMLDDIADFELKEIVDDIDKKGNSDHYFTPGYETDELYDYRKFDIEENNSVLKRNIKKIKYGYEVGE